MDKFHNQKLPHLIYAILWEDDGNEFAFVGKTTTADTKALLRRHLRGEVTVTKRYLKSNDWGEKPPRLIVLHSLVCTGAEAYKYILCYLRLYENFGVMTVAYRETENQAYDMLPYTQQLYEDLQKTVTRDFLLVGITIAKPATEKPVRKQEKELTAQLNVRLEIPMLGAFQQFCSNLGITQKEGFLHLMRHVDQSKLAEDPLFVELRETITRQKRRINELEMKLQTESRGQKADTKLKATVVNIRKLVAQYIDNVAERPTDLPLKDPAHEVYAGFKDYAYPDTDGDTILELRDLYYSHGKNPAAFLCGTDLKNGALIKLRYYPRENYISCAPGGKYCVENARWLISYRRAADGAMELVAALPLPLYMERDVIEAPDSSNEKKWLDEIIQEASLLISY